VKLWNIDRLLLYRLYPSLLDAIIIVQPETVIRWHRRGFRAYWSWKSRHVGSRPRIESEIRALIRRMSRENPMWGAPRIHGELLMLGIEVAESTVGRYMVRGRRPPSQGWKTFLRNHAAGIASLDPFVVRTISFKLLYGLVILSHAGRRLVTISATTNPTAEWIAGQVTDAFPWDEAPSHLIRDRDGVFGQPTPIASGQWGSVIIRPRRAHRGRTGTSSTSSDQYVANASDHVVVFGEVHLRRVLSNYASYYKQVRTHLALDKPITLPLSMVAKAMTTTNDRQIGNLSDQLLPPRSMVDWRCGATTSRDRGDETLSAPQRGLKVLS
jgi:hypothetical protein